MANVFEAVGSAVGGVVSGGVGSVVTTGLSAIDALISRFKASPEAAMKHEEAAAALEAAREQSRMTFELQLAQAQTKINEIEAASTSFWVSGWRPGVGWTCVVGLNMALLVGPFFTWASAWISTGRPGPFPSLDIGTLMTLVTSMLGTAYLRSQEKLAGVAK